MWTSAVQLCSPSDKRPQRNLLREREVVQSCPTATPWMVAHQAPLSMGDPPGKNTGVGCHFPSPGDLPHPGVKPRGIPHCWGTLPTGHPVERPKCKRSGMARSMHSVAEPTRPRSHEARGIAGTQGSTSAWQGPQGQKASGGRGGEGGREGRERPPAGQRRGEELLWPSAHCPGKTHSLRAAPLLSRLRAARVPPTPFWGVPGEAPGFAQGVH